MASSYSIVVPPGFVHIPGGGDAEARTNAFFDQMPTEIGEDSSLVAEFRNGLTNVLAADATGSLVDAFILPGAIPGVELACSVVVAAIVVPPEQRGDLNTHLLQLVSSRGATACSIGGDPAVLWDGPREEGSSRDVTAGHRVVFRRTAISRIAGIGDRLMSFVLTVVSRRDESDLTADDRAGEALLIDAFGVLFDGMLLSVRWVDEEGRALVHGVAENERSRA